MLSIPTRSPNDHLTFEQLHSRAVELLPRLWTLYLHQCNKTQVLTELLSRDNLNLNPTARTVIGVEIAASHDTAKAHFESWLYLHELVDAKTRADLSTWQFRRSRSIIHEVELFLEHQKAMREKVGCANEHSHENQAPDATEPPTGE